MLKESETAGGRLRMLGGGSETAGGMLRESESAGTEPRL
jgi:hypothetical protein